MDVEFAKEQARVEAHRRRLDGIGSDRRKRLFGGKDEHRELQEKTKTEMEHHLELREEGKKLEALEDLKYSAELQEQVNLSQIVAEDHEKARREFLVTVKEQNIKLAEEKEKMKKSEVEKELALGPQKKDFFDLYERSFR